MKKIFAYLIILIMTVVFLTYFVESAFVLDNTFQVEKAYKNNNLLRLHIVANSDSPRDQYIKRKVRNGVITTLMNKNEDNIKEQLKCIKETSQNIIDKYSNVSNVDVSLDHFYFPCRTYGDITLPEGKYKAVKIELGKGCGTNWWCVLVPPLCFEEKNFNYSSSKKLILKMKLFELFNIYDRFLAVKAEENTSSNYNNIFIYKNIVSEEILKSIGIMPQVIIMDPLTYFR